MNFKLTSTELIILNILTKNGGRVKTIDLVHLFQDIHPKTPKQTIYRSIRSLKKKEIIIVSKGFTTINTHWIGNMRQRLEMLESHSLHQILPDRASFSFPSFLTLAPVFTHYFNVLVSQTDTSKPIIFINPHQWFYAAREWSEDQLINMLEAEGYTLWQGINYMSEIDKSILKKHFTNRSNIRGSFITPKKNELDTYVVIVGDNIMKITSTPEFSKTINEIYDSAESVTEEVRIQIENALRTSGKMKLIITKNKRVADSYRSLMKKFIGKTVSSAK